MRAARCCAAGVEDAEDNVTRFAWLAPTGAELPDPDPDARWRTTLVFSELGEDHPGALVDALAELSSRAINMTRIESRPRRVGLGTYMFFIDLDGSAADATVAEGIEALRGAGRDRARPRQLPGRRAAAAVGGECARP